MNGTLVKSDAKNILGSENIDNYNLITSRNFGIENELVSCTVGITPTQWQANQFPILLKSKLRVIFDGIDTSFFHPPKQEENDTDTIIIKGEFDECVINKDDVLVTYATRGMEPLRGFPEFVQMLPKLFDLIPCLKVIIGGRDRSAYGPPAPTHNGSWKEKTFDEIGEFKYLDRIIFPGLMSYEEYRKMLWRTNLTAILQNHM